MVALSSSDTHAGLAQQIVRTLFGAQDPQKTKFAESLYAALAKISDKLVPTDAKHPLAALIREGTSAFPQLIEGYDKCVSDAERESTVDAMAEICSRQWATDVAAAHFHRVLQETKDRGVASKAARGLALAGDTTFLDQQILFLVSDDDERMRTAALLLGYGRHVPAVPALLELLSPERIADLDVIIWALGEIGDAAAGPPIEMVLSDFIEVEAACEALGKIGSYTAVMQLMSVLAEAPEAPRVKAAEAMARIAAANMGVLGNAELTAETRAALERTAQTDPSLEVRFYAMVAFAYLKGEMAPNLIKKSLGAKLKEADLGAVAGFFTNRKDTAAPPRRPRATTKQGVKPARGGWGRP